MKPTWVMNVPTSESVVVMVEGELGDQSEATPCNLSERIRTIMRGRRNTTVILVELTATKK